MTWKDLTSGTTVLPPGPCTNSFLAFGSMGRGEATPYSDIEFGLMQRYWFFASQERFLGRPCFRLKQKVPRQQLHIMQNEDALLAVAKKAAKKWTDTPLNIKDEPELRFYNPIPHWQWIWQWAVLFYHFDRQYILPEESILEIHKMQIRRIC